MLRILLITILLTSASATINCDGSYPSEDHPKYIPDNAYAFNIIGKGYNERNSDPVLIPQYSNDNGIGARVIDLDYDYNPSSFCNQDIFYPVGATCYGNPNIPDSVEYYAISALEDVYSYLKYYYAQGYASTDEGDSYFQSSTFLIDQFNYYNNLGLVMIVEQVEVITHVAGIQNLCNQQISHVFRNAVERLPPLSDDSTAYSDFYDQFGTSFVYEASFGGRMMAIYGVETAGSPRCIDDFLNDDTLFFFGGNTHEINYSDSPVDTFMSTLINHPIVLFIENGLITDLMTSYFFPEKQSIGDRANDYNTYLYN